MFKRFISAVVALVSLALFAARADAAGSPIDWFTLNTFGGYSETYSATSPFSNSGLLLLGEPEVYHLHNGATWGSGAGSFSSVYAKKTSIAVNGSQIAYTLDLPVGSTIFSATDYDSGNDSSNGRLVSTEPLVLRATSGSKTAILSGFGQLTFNDYSNYTDDRFHFFNAPVGSLVPFNVTYTLNGAPTWQTNTMDGTFDYNLAGTVDFRNAITPEPAGLALGIMLLTPVLCGRRRRIQRLALRTGYVSGSCAL
jgi:hypothetical protein